MMIDLEKMSPRYRIPVCEKKLIEYAPDTVRWYVADRMLGICRFKLNTLGEWDPSDEMHLELCEVLLGVRQPTTLEWIDGDSSRAG